MTMTHERSTPESDISLGELNETTMDDVEEVSNDKEFKSSASKLLNDDDNNADQQEFNNLSNDSKLERLDNLIKKSQIYSQIIADQILANTKLKKEKLQEEENSENSENAGHTRSSKRRKKDVLEMLAKPKKSDTKQPKLVTGGKLKDYQLDGLEWLITLYENGLNGILADEMGLGKTIQCIAFISFLIENGITGPYLIVAPLSTISNWYREFSLFAPSLKVLQYVGSKEDRKPMTFKDYNIVLISYELSIKDFNKLSNQDWKFLIIDEGHRLKNIECILIKALKKLNVSNRLLITGTPLQNNLNELWSLLNFILPDIFHDLQLFQQWFNFDEIVNIGKANAEKDDEVNKFIEKNLKSNLIKNLHTILKPFILRRLKKEVIKNLPPKKEYLIHVELSDYQKKLYNDTLNNQLYDGIFELYYKDYQKFNLAGKYKNNAKAKSQLSSGINKILKKSLKLQNLVMQLRSICNSPYNYYEPLPINDETLTEYDTSPPIQKRESIFINELLNNSCKFKVLHQFIHPLIENGHKVLIFSQFTKTLDLLNDYFNFYGVGLCRFDGSTNQLDRDEQIQLFDQEIDRKVFLLSTRSGGLGINLTQADSVIIFDNDWNPQMDLQAIDRCHRIGQYKPVKIYRFLVKQSIEELLIIKNYSKRFLEKLIIQMGENTFNKLSNYEIEFNNLIKLSKQFGFMGQIDDKGEQSDEGFRFNYNKVHEIKMLTDEEIKELLDRSESNFKSNKSFENISVFETINKLDE